MNCPIVKMLGPLNLPLGSDTETLALPLLDTSLAGMWAETMVVPEEKLGRASPFQCTTAPSRKFSPYTVIWNGPEPVGTPIGFISRMVGSSDGSLGSLQANSPTRTARPGDRRSREQ